MARRLSALGWALPSRRRRVQFAALVLAVIGMHSCVTRNIAERMEGFATTARQTNTNRTPLEPLNIALTRAATVSGRVIDAAILSEWAEDIGGFLADGKVGLSLLVALGGGDQ